MLDEDSQDAAHRPAGAAPPMAHEDRAALHRVVNGRRDVRRGFLPDPIPRELLRRVLGAAHAAPSVGFMQPWRFVLLGKGDARDALIGSFESANEAARKAYGDADRRDHYGRLKLSALEEAPLVLVVACDHSTGRGHGLGRQTWPEAARDSTVAAVQNLMLAARAEGLGTGWVSILDKDDVRRAAGLPDDVEPIAVLCVGFVERFEAKPDLERAGWESRASLEDLVHVDRFGGPSPFASDDA
ncbi:MAG: 5,6-dimethylbenzimidazole synthase [Planctomycetota bacterium]